MDSTKAMKIRVERLDVKRSKRLILKDISFEIASGEVTVIVGRSGVGKTTLLGALNGLLPCSAGSISISGLGELAEPRVLLEHRRRLATVFQERALIGRLSALDNVLLGFAGACSPFALNPFSREQERLAIRALTSVGLAQTARSRVERLSGGEQQRVGIARALVREPSLLLGDEPFSSVDPSFVRYLCHEFRQLVENSRLAVVLTLHQLTTARAVADRIIGLCDGTVVFNGKSSEFDAAAERVVFGT
jgi:phosphonate transport system ATP-binding protein